MSKKLPTKGQSPGDFLGHEIQLSFLTIVRTRAQNDMHLFFNSFTLLAEIFGNFLPTLKRTFGK